MGLLEAHTQITKFLCFERGSRNPSMFDQIARDRDHCLHCTLPTQSQREPSVISRLRSADNLLRMNAKNRFIFCFVLALLIFSNLY